MIGKVFKVKHSPRTTDVFVIVADVGVGWRIFQWRNGTLEFYEKKDLENAIAEGYRVEVKFP